MKTRKRNDQNGNRQSIAQRRASISFPPDIYAVLEDIAKEKKVSLAWVVRDAAENYIADKLPLSAGQE